MTCSDNVEPETCRFCGADLLADDDVVESGDGFAHVACAEAPVRQKPRKLSQFSAFGTRGQMDLSETQREV